MHEPRFRGGFIGPLLLLGFGMLFLLNNLGLTQIDIWGMVFQLWSLILVALGVDILLGRRSQWASLLSVLLIAGIFIGGFLLYQSSSSDETSADYSVDVSRANATSADIKLAPPIGVVRIGETVSVNTLITGFVDGWPEDGLQENLQNQGSKRIYSLRSLPVETAIPLMFPGRTPTWELQVGQGTVVHLDLDLGVGDAHLELNRLQLSELDFEMGVGRLRAALPQGGGYRVSISGGVGLIILDVPSDENIRIEVDRGLTAIQVPSSYRQTDGAYVSTSYGGSSDPIEIFVSLGVGNILIREINQ